MASGDYPEAGRVTRSNEAAAPSKPPKKGIVLSETVREAPTPEALTSIAFSFTPPTIFAGDCSLGADTLELFSDGRGEWRANSVMSSDPGEDAFCCTFELFDAHDISIWKFGKICSPTLNPTPIVWEDNNRLFFPSFIFDSIGGASMTYSC